MKYILINGGSGFMGSRLIQLFDKKKLKIHLKKKNEKLFKSYNTFHLDFSEKKLDFSFLKNVKTVIHAASLNKEESDKYPKKAKIINYDFVEKLVEACKKYNVNRLIKISTSKVYGDNLNEKVTENSPLKPFNNYTFNHSESDNFLENYGKYHGLDIVILRVSNGYGYPGFNNQKCWNLIVNNFCFDAYHKQEIKINSNINYIKNFVDMCYITKVIKFFNDYPNKISGIFNVGSKENISLYDMALKIKRIAKKNNLGDINISSNFISKNNNLNYSYSIKKLLELECNIKENKEIEIDNLFYFLKKKYA